MELLRIHIDNFGKIHDLTLDFHEGINVIKEPNAWGKSTLAAFIRVMFYGLEPKKLPGMQERERSFYNPWQGGVFGGELDFRVNGRSYRIMRTFGASEKKDSCHVYDLSTNLESVDFVGNVGEQLFDLDSGSFKRSVFIAQNDCESQTSDAINAKLGNLAANTNDINNYETAQELLKGLANSLTPNRATGSIKKRKLVIAELEDEIRGYQAAMESLERFTAAKKSAEENKANYQAKRDELANQLKIASEDSSRQQKQRQYLELCTDVVAKLEVLGSFSETFPVGAPDEEAFARAIEASRQLEERNLHASHLDLTEEEETQYARLCEMFEKSVPTEQDIDAAINAYGKLVEVKEDKMRYSTSLEEREKKSMIVEPLPEKPKSVNQFTVLGIIFSVLGLATFIGAIYMFLKKEYPPFYMFVGVGLLVVATVLFTIAAVVQKKKQNQYEVELSAFKKRQQDEIEEIMTLKRQAEGNDAKQEQILKDTEAFLERYQVFCGVAGYSAALYEMKAQVKDFHRLKSRKKEKEETEFACREFDGKINRFAEEWKLALGTDAANQLIFLQTEAAKYRSAEFEANRANERKKAFEHENDMADLELTVQADGTLAEINAQIAEYDNLLEEVRDEIEQYSRQMEDLKLELDAMDDKRSQLEELQILQNEESHRFEILTQTQEYLRNAREQFTARYMAPISNAFRKYYNVIMQSTEEDDWVIDANVELKRREQGELREVYHLSAGYQDLIGVCMRLALVDAMYQDEKPFLVLDDPFVNLDEAKTAKGMELLDYVAGEYQTIYFTCHNSRTP